MIILLSIIILEILLFALIKNKIVKYIGILISVILNIIPKEYPFGYQLILNLVITIIAIIFLIRQKYLIEKEKGIYTNYESSLGLRVICFLIPLVGLIIYAVNIVQNPKIAKECGKVSLIGVIIGLVISLATTFIIIYG